MLIKLIKKIEHRFVPKLKSQEKLDLKHGKKVDVDPEAAAFLLHYQYVVQCVAVQPKVVLKPKTKTTFNKEAE